MYWVAARDSHRAATISPPLERTGYHHRSKKQIIQGVYRLRFREYLGEYAENLSYSGTGSLFPLASRFVHEAMTGCKHWALGKSGCYGILMAKEAGSSA